MFSFAQIALWFATSKTGRMLAAAGTLALAIGVALLKAFSAGKQSERAAEDARSLENLRDRAGSDAEINNLGHADLDERARRWLRRDEPRE